MVDLECIELRVWTINVEKEPAKRDENVTAHRLVPRL